jgi:hypothetical protein
VDLRDIHQHNCANISAQDIEANRSTSTATAPASRTATSEQLSDASQDYAHMGRGGAGNWYEPKELQKEGTFVQPTDATGIPTSSKPQVSTPWHPENQELPVARAGRGGAGNFVWRSAQGEEAGKKEREEEERREGLRVQAEKSVEGSLARPPGAVLGRETEKGLW